MHFVESLQLPELDLTEIQRQIVVRADLPGLPPNDLPTALTDEKAMLPGADYFVSELGRDLDQRLDAVRMRATHLSRTEARQDTVFSRDLLDRHRSGLR